MFQVIVTKQHRSKFPNPIKLSKDEVVQVGKRDDEWEGWIWCTSKTGIEGWVPEKYLQISDEKAVVLKEYDATELDVEVDDSLTVYLEESGWYWCQKENGEKGWVPVESVRIID